MNRIKKKIFNYLMKDLFKMVTEDEILKTSERGKLTLNGKELTQAEINLLAEEAETLMQLSALRYILNEMEQLARKKIYEDSLNMDDVNGGKMMLYYSDVLKLKIKKLAQFKK